jgi:hypothetical protein
MSSTKAVRLIATMMFLSMSFVLYLWALRMLPHRSTAGRKEEQQLHHLTARR